MNRDSLREAVLGTGAWSKAGVVLNESTAAPAEEVIEEATEEVEETIEEGVEAGHACPLCHHTLAESLSDERLAEHAEAFMNALAEAGIIEEAEGGEEEEEEEEEAIEEEESCDDDEKKDDKPAFMKKKSEKKDKK